MAKKGQLTIKQAKFIDVYIKTGNATEAAMQAYDTTRHVARRIGSENLSKLDHIVRHVMEERGLTLPMMVDTVKEATKADKWNDFTGEREPDHTSRLKAVTIASKWMGLEPKNNDKQTNVQVNIATSIKGDMNDYADE